MSQQPWASPVQRTLKSSNHPLSHDLKDIYHVTFTLLFSPTLDSLLNSHTLHSSSTSPLSVLVAGPALCPVVGHYLEVGPPPPGSPEQFLVHLGSQLRIHPCFLIFYMLSGCLLFISILAHVTLYPNGWLFLCIHQERETVRTGTTPLFLSEVASASQGMPGSGKW